MIPTTPVSGIEVPTSGNAADATRSAGASGPVPIEPRLEPSDKNAAAVLRLLREIARSGA